MPITNRKEKLRKTTRFFCCCNNKNKKVGMVATKSTRMHFMNTVGACNIYAICYMLYTTEVLITKQQFNIVCVFCFVLFHFTS